MRLLTTVMKRGTIEATLNICNYLQSIPREAKRLRLITAPPAHHSDGWIKTPQPEPPLSRLPVQLACTKDYRGCPLTRLMVMLYVLVHSSEPRFTRWNEFHLKRGVWEIPGSRPALDGAPFSTGDTKVAEEIHVVPLSPQTVISREQNHTITVNFELVLAGNAKPWKLMPENTVNTALRTTGYDTKVDICGHGFRAMACSALVESGLWSETAIERQMSHKERNNVRAAYTHKAEFLEERRMIMT